MCFLLPPVRTRFLIIKKTVLPRVMTTEKIHPLNLRDTFTSNSLYWLSTAFLSLTDYQDVALQLNFASTTDTLPSRSTQI